MFTDTRRAITVIVAAMIVGLPVSIWAGRVVGRPDAAAQSTIRPFPSAVPGYRLAYTNATVVRVFDDRRPQTVPEFPAAMNGCDLQRFYVRWRSVNPYAHVEIRVVSMPDLIDGGPPLSHSGGLWEAHGCQQPAFVLRSVSDTSTLTDVAVEYQVWRASP